jgi:hypothetical protein
MKLLQKIFCNLSRVEGKNSQNLQLEFHSSKYIFGLYLHSLPSPFKWCGVVWCVCVCACVCVCLLKSVNDTYAIKQTVNFAVFDLGKEEIIEYRLLHRLHAKYVIHTERCWNRMLLFNSTAIWCIPVAQLSSRLDHKLKCNAMGGEVNNICHAANLK